MIYPEYIRKIFKMYRVDTHKHLLSKDSRGDLLFTDGTCFCHTRAAILANQHLAVVGDMGSFVFTFCPNGHLSDVFVKPYPPLGYWAEKVRAVDASCGMQEYSYEEAEQEIRRAVDDWFDPEESDVADLHRRAQLLELVHSDLLPNLKRLPSNQLTLARTHVYEFMDLHVEGRDLTDQQWDLSRFTSQFVWTCFAVCDMFRLNAGKERMSDDLSATA